MPTREGNSRNASNRNMNDARQSAERRRKSNHVALDLGQDDNDLLFPARNLRGEPQFEAQRSEKQATTHLRPAPHVPRQTSKI